MTDENLTPTVDVVSEISRHCLLTRARLMSRVITSIYDQELRPFGINSPQFTLLVLVSRLECTSRAEIGRVNHQDRSTLARNLKLMLSQGWVEDKPAKAGGRAKLIKITDAGQGLVHRAAPAWRRAQLHAKDILGETGVVAITGIANGLGG